MTHLSTLEAHDFVQIAPGNKSTSLVVIWLVEVAVSREAGRCGSQLSRGNRGSLVSRWRGQLGLKTIDKRLEPALLGGSSVLTGHAGILDQLGRTRLGTAGKQHGVHVFGDTLGLYSHN